MSDPPVHGHVLGCMLQAMAKIKVLSAPLVINPSLEDMDEDRDDNSAPPCPQLIGWIDIADILRNLISRERDLKDCIIRLNTS